MSFFSVSYEVYAWACCQYAEQLKKQHQYQKAATYFIAIGQFRNAIELMIESGNFRDAAMIARIRLPPQDPLLKNVFTKWAEKMRQDGNFEMAAKW